ncbi:MarR family winged helix-turn-helix transcriptional regulator [Parvibaculum sp.]|jgi:DNA-binding MarR family transcriptional regulator|uniref:MarR family winged helix-turn-helix transcriptional regulator n=1 Tax=Parvibaculum sp. TaxID=2024848 RepID=UPI003C76E415
MTDKRNGTGPNGQDSDAAHIDRRLILMARTVVVLFREFEKIARELDITIPQYRFLLFLKRGPKRAGELAVEAAIRKPTASGLIADMERRGLIARAPDKEDGRSVKLSLTPKGLKKHREFEEALARYLPSLLDQGDQERMLEAFSELAYIIDSQRGNAEEAMEELAEDTARG